MNKYELYKKILEYIRNNNIKHRFYSDEFRITTTFGYQDELIYLIKYDNVKLIYSNKIYWNEEILELDMSTIIPVQQLELF